MKKVFRYRLDKRSKRATWLTVAVVALVTAFLTWYLFNSGAYVSAWIITVALSVLALYILSIPRRIVVTQKTFEIHCVVELTTIELEDLVCIRTIPDKGTRLWLLLGSYGFFGYYGYYLDWKRWEFVKVYASAWRDLVEIVDIYEQRYIVNCPDPETLVFAVNRAKARLTGKQEAAEKPLSRPE